MFTIQEIKHNNYIKDDESFMEINETIFINKFYKDGQNLVVFIDPGEIIINIIKHIYESLPVYNSPFTTEESTISLTIKKPIEVKDLLYLLGFNRLLNIIIFDEYFSIETHVITEKGTDLLTGCCEFYFYRKKEINKKDKMWYPISDNAKLYISLMQKFDYIKDKDKIEFLNKEEDITPEKMKYFMNNFLKEEEQLKLIDVIYKRSWAYGEPHVILKSTWGVIDICRHWKRLIEDNNIHGVYFSRG